MSLTHDDGSQKYLPTLVIVPAASIATCKKNIDARLDDQLRLRLWYGTPKDSSLGAVDRARTLGSSIASLRSFVHGLDTHDPATETYVVLTSTSTYCSRAMLDNSTKTVTEADDSTEDDADLEEERNIAKTEEMSMRKGMTRARLNAMEHLHLDCLAA